MVESTEDKFIKDAKIRIAGEDYGDEVENEDEAVSTVNVQSSGRVGVSTLKANKQREAALIPTITAAGGTPSLSAAVVKFFTPFFSTPAQTFRALKTWHARDDQSHHKTHSNHQHPRQEQKPPPAEPQQ